jgi:putative endopeptidase
MSRKGTKKSCPIPLKSFEEDYEPTDNALEILSEKLKEEPDKKTELPNDNFYNFINTEWINKIDLEESSKYISQIDDFRVVQHKVYNELIDLVKENKDNIGMQAIYESGLKRLTKKQALKHIHNYKTFLEDCSYKNDIWGFLGAANRNEIYKFGLPLVMDVYADEKDSKTMRTHIGIPQSTLVDNNVYYPEFAETKEDIKYNEDYKAKYFEYIAELSDLSGEKMIPENIWDIELLIINELYDENAKGDDKVVDGYFNLKPEQLNDMGIDWRVLTSYYGFNSTTNELPRAITQNKGYVKRITKHLRTAFRGKDREKWKEYFLYLFIKQICIFTEKWKELHYNFHGVFMRGADADFPDELFPIFCLAFCYNTKLTNLYYDTFADQQKLDYVTVLANDLKIVFRRKIERNDWMQPETKAKALEKLDNFSFTFGKPENLGNDAPLENSYVDDDIYSNFLKIIDYRAKMLVNNEGMSILDTPSIDWFNYPIKLTGSQAYVVNASYTPSKNGIYIPLGYLQKPFLDLDERGIELNLAYLGFTIGHEMSHSLDDLGSQYDAHGNWENWWSREDKKIYKQKQKDVNDQYTQWYLRDGIKGFDATLAVGENVADISGLSICVEYLENYQSFNKDIIPIKAISFKAFFIYFAYQMKQKILKSAYINQLKTNPHAFSVYRCNVPLSRTQLFIDMYNVKEGDGMYWKNVDTIF